MKKNLNTLLVFSIAYIFLLLVGLSIFYLFFKMKFTDIAVISNIFVWSATLFAPVTAYFIFDGWKTQHNKSVERILAENSSANLNIVKENLGQIYYILYLNKITHPFFYPVTDKPVPKFILDNIMDLNLKVINSATSINRDLMRLGRKNHQIRIAFDEFNNEYNNLHSNIFFFVDQKLQGGVPDLKEEATKQKFIELYDHYHSFSRVSEQLDMILDDIIFI